MRVLAACAPATPCPYWSSVSCCHVRYLATMSGTDLEFHPTTSGTDLAYPATRHPEERPLKSKATQL
eukprot:3626650-Rhodomonas_salina.1